jgi:glycosyltransferase involved in cell wall biosynthesis
MRVAIVHDDLVQWGGAERVLEAICEIYPDAPIFTSVYDSKNKELKKRFGDKKIITSFLQKLPFWKSFYKALFLFYPIAFEQFDFSEYDLVISHTTRFAKSIITKPETSHICYCHTPPRFLWNLSGYHEYSWLKPIFNALRKYDQISSKRVDYFLAGSENAKQRIKEIYNADSMVVYPFVDLERFKNIESFDGGYFVVIARLNSYKRVDLAVEACKNLGLPLKVIGVGPEIERLREIGDKRNIEFLGSVSDELVAQVLAGCRALIVPGIEDFGITPLEAQALGKGVIAYKEGGTLETVIEGKTGLFFNGQTIMSLSEVLASFDPARFNSDNCRKNAAKFNKQSFIQNFKEKIAAMS